MHLHLYRLRADMHLHLYRLRADMHPHLYLAPTGCRASVWSARAVAERLEYSMNEANVRVGVLVQPFVATGISNGVALTDYRPDRGRFMGVYLNAMTGGANRVTDAAEAEAGDVATEQVVVIMSRLPGVLEYARQTAPIIARPFAPLVACAFAPLVACSFAPLVACAFAPLVACAFAPLVACAFAPLDIHI